MQLVAIRKTKLIEVALPLDALNEGARAETSNPFIKGHPKSLKWWTRKPLSVARGVLLAQLIDDPSADPARFPTVEAQEDERDRRLKLVGDVSNWGATNDEGLLQQLQELVRESGGPNGLPVVADIFSGGGSIPLEAARLGLGVLAEDLNPIAAMLTRAIVSVPSRWSGSEPVSPTATLRASWSGADGLAEDVRSYAALLEQETRDAVEAIYAPGLEDEGLSVSDVVAWIWARMVICRNPACLSRTPLVSSYELAKKKGRRAWVRPIKADGDVTFEVEVGDGGPPEPPKVGSRGAKFRCVHCSEIMDAAAISRALAESEGDYELMALVIDGSPKQYASTGRRMLSYKAEQDGSFDDVLVPDDPRAFWFRQYGCRTVSDLFTDRQRAALLAAFAAFERVLPRIEGDALEHGLSSEDAAEYSRAVGSLLLCGLGRALMFNNKLCAWNRTNENVANPFAMTAPVFSWEIAESNILYSKVGIQACCDKVAEILEHSLRLPRSDSTDVRLGDAASFDGQNTVVHCTDPPYYDNAVYSDLADFFYVPIRKALSLVSPDLAVSIASPRLGELVVADYRDEGITTRESFATGFAAVAERLKDTQDDRYPLVLYYAYKQSETTDDSGLTSTGWSSVLQAIVDSGLQIVATWPLRTERDARSRSQNSNALASTIVLVCRPRSSDAAIVDRRGLLQALRERLPGPLRELQRTHIAPVDLRQSAIGPGMSVYSSFAQVVEPDGEQMQVRTALGLINQVLDEVLDAQEEEFDAQTRWAINWFSQFFFDEGRYGTAEQLAVSMNVAVSGMVDAGILEAGGGKVRLLARDELPADWDPVTDLRTPVWEATQHLVKRLETEGEASAARLLRRMGGLGESAQLLAYRLYTVCERTRPNLAGPFNALVASWPEIQRLAREASEPIIGFEQQSLDT